MKEARKNEVHKEFFRDNCYDLAQELLGDLLISKKEGEKTGGIIVETEAYLGEKDPACHYKGKNGKRDKIFDKGPGTVYVYKIHGHNCMNFICGTRNYPEGVLIRSLEPTKNIQKMKDRRGVEEKTEIASGPGKLTEALNITKEDENGEKISQSSVSLYSNDTQPEVEISQRIGISKAENWPLRFKIKNNQYVSKLIDKKINKNFQPREFYQKVENI